MYEFKYSFTDEEWLRVTTGYVTVPPSIANWKSTLSPYVKRHSVILDEPQHNLIWRNYIWSYFTIGRTPLDSIVEAFAAGVTPPFEPGDDVDE